MGYRHGLTHRHGLWALNRVSADTLTCFGAEHGMKLLWPSLCTCLYFSSMSLTRKLYPCVCVCVCACFSKPAFYPSSALNLYELSLWHPYTTAKYIFRTCLCHSLKLSQPYEDKSTLIVQ